MNYKCFSTKYSPSICTWMGIFSPPILICLPFHLSALLPSTSPAGDALVAGGFLLWTKAGHRGTISDSSYKLVHYCLALDSSCTPAHPSIHPSIHSQLHAFSLSSPLSLIHLPKKIDLLDAIHTYDNHHEQHLACRRPPRYQKSWMRIAGSGLATCFANHQAENGSLESTPRLMDWNSGTPLLAYEYFVPR